MRKVKLSCSLFIMFIAALVPGRVFAADVDNFYFEDFTGDYYLSRDEEGLSRLKVVESFTAVFPDYKQNKGICRMIPFTNRAETNVTLPNLSESNLKLTRNGNPEPIYSIEKEKNYYEVCTGDESYVLGKQVYVFEYEFEKVVADFSGHQELYWDTNGNGWIQRFENVTARLHFAEDVISDYTGESWCYVGKYGDSGMERCDISAISDGVQFKTTNLTRGENLTFDVELKSGSFVVPEPDKNYTLVYIMAGVWGACILLLISPFRKFLKTREKAKYYKDLFVKPEFTPDRNYGVAEMAEIYIGKKHDAKVAVLLDMIVNHQITLLKKGETRFGKKKWAVKILDATHIPEEGMYLLEILAGGKDVNNGDEIEIKTRTANSKLIMLKNKYKRTIIESIKTDGLAEKNYKGYEGSGFVWAFTIAVILFSAMATMVSLDYVDFLIGDLVGEDIFQPVLFAGFATFIIASGILSKGTDKFLYRTKKGLLASRYMDGLKLYIGMAEKDRLAFLQSVKGVEVTNEGVVKLYEKLLPYAAVLGLEKSWMKELEKYYQLEDVETPNWYTHDLAAYSILRVVDSAVSTVNYSTTYSSSGGSSSSGFSGGGGGGFSGGGGGGGGGHGR